MNNKQWPATIDEAVGVVIAALPEAERRHVREQLAQLIATHPALRGQATVSYPYKTHAFMAVRR